VTSLKRFNSYEIFNTGEEKGPFNTGDHMGRFDLLIQVTNTNFMVLVSPNRGSNPRSAKLKVSITPQKMFI
jgi:hypothetical protein